MEYCVCVARGSLRYSGGDLNGLCWKFGGLHIYTKPLYMGLLGCSVGLSQTLEAVCRQQRAANLHFEGICLVYGVHVQAQHLHGDRVPMAPIPNFSDEPWRRVTSKIRFDWQFHSMSHLAEEMH